MIFLSVLLNENGGLIPLMSGFWEPSYGVYGDFKPPVETLITILDLIPWIEKMGYDVVRKY